MSNAPALEDQIIAALRRITRAIDLHSRLLLQKHGLTAPQLVALRSAYRMGPVTVGALAREIHLGQATVTGILDRLEKRGLVFRVRDDRDRRSVVVQLTEQGSELAEEAPSLLQDQFHRELAQLQEWEQTMILATLQRIASMMDAEAIEAVPVLGPGVAGAAEEDVSRYLQRAVVSTDDGPLAEELTGTSRESTFDPPASGSTSQSGTRCGGGERLSVPKDTGGEARGRSA